MQQIRVTWALATYAHGSVKGCCTKFPVNASDHGRGKPKSLPSMSCNILCNHLDYRVPSFLPRDLPLQKQQESRRSRSYIMCSYNCVMGDQRVGAAALLIFFINFVSPPHVGRGDVGVRGGVPCRRHGDGQYVSAGYCGRRFLRASSNKGTGWKTVPSYQSQPPTFASSMKFAGLPTDSDKFATGTFYRRNLTDRAVFADTVE